MAHMNTRGGHLALAVAVTLAVLGCGDDAQTNTADAGPDAAGIGPGGIYVPDADLDANDDEDAGSYAGLVPRSDAGACIDPVAESALEFAVKVDNQPYVVRGNTAAELRAQMDALRPADGDYVIGWSVRWENENATCPATFSMQVEIAYAYPEWDAPEDADPALVEQWNQQLDGVWCFHWGAARLVISSANDLLAELRAIQAHEPAPSCTEAKTAALAANEQAKQQLSDAVGAYNTATDRGRKLGAHFP